MLDNKTIKEMPKIELHCHLDGSLSVDVIRQMAINENIQLPEKDEDLKANIHAPQETHSLLDYLACFDYVLPLLQTKENLELAAYDVAKQAADENVKYIEIRFAPMHHTKKGLNIIEVTKAICKGFEQAEADFDIKVGGLICGLRHESVDKLMTLLEIFADENEDIISHYIVGFDLAGDEENFPPKLFAPLLEKVKQKGVNLTLHAGECGCSQNIFDSIELGASRIGHGVAIHENPDEFSFLKEKNITFEMAPTSNFQTKAIESLELYPFKELFDAGVAVTINTDNRTVSDTNLVKEYRKIRDWYDFTLDDFLKININAIEGSFVTGTEKETLLDKIILEYKQLG